MRLFILISCFMLTACMGRDHVNYLKIRDIPEPTIQNFTHCYSYGCEKRKELSLPEETTNRLQSVFSLPSHTKEIERNRIAQAIQIFEQDIGALAGTQHDIRGTFRLYESENVIRGPQQDCIDESTNTTIYITLLEQLGMLQFYEPSFTANRQPFFSGAPWWHQTAVIKDKDTGEKFAVDSWFKSNGETPYIVSYKEWKDGWLPSKK